MNKIAEMFLVFSSGVCAAFLLFALLHQCEESKLDEQALLEAEKAGELRGICTVHKLVMDKDLQECIKKYGSFEK